MLAKKTLDAIDKAYAKDGGAAFRQLQQQTLPLCADAYSPKQDEHRTHLGASMIGRQCGRELWYGFHWASTSTVEPRMRRLWNRGHLEEGRMVALLLLIGVRVWQLDPQGNQFRMKGHGGHYGGSLDAVLEGIPDVPDQPILGEFKTHNDKSFTKLVNDGLHESKFEHYVQMQQYMRHRQLNWGLYLAVNKNNDALHGELIELNAELADRYTDRAGGIIAASAPPQRISEKSSWWQCRFCDHKQVCHHNAPPERNCRTCSYSRVVEGGWACHAVSPAPLIPVAVQRTGCAHYTRASWNSEITR